MANAAQNSNPRLQPSGLGAERRLALLVFIIACAYLFLFRRCTDLDPDEGIILQGTQRILRGEVLYRDFFSFFTPGSYYFLVCLFKIFGNSFLVARTALAVMGGVISLVHYLLARRVCSRWSALIVTALVTTTCLPYRFLVLHNWDSTLWASLALYCAVRFLETGNWKFEIRKLKIGNLWALGTGSFVALTFLFEQSKGAGLIFGLGAGWLALVWLSRQRSGRGSQQGTENSQPEIGNWKLEIENSKACPLDSRFCGNDQGAGMTRGSKIEPTAYGLLPSAFCRLPTAFCFLGGLLWPFLLTFLYFGAQHSLAPMLADWFWPLQHYTRANHVPYGYQDLSESAVRSLFFSGSWFERFVTVLTLSPCFVVPVLPLISFGLLVYWVRQMGRQEPVAEASRSSAVEGQEVSRDTGRGDHAFPDSTNTNRRNLRNLWITRCSYFVLINATLCGLLLSIVMVRANVVHFMYLGPFFYLVLAWVMDGRDIPGRVFATLRPLLNAYIVTAFGLLSMPLLLRAIQTPYRLETRQGVVASPGKDTVIRFIQAHVPPGQKILVYPYLPLYYYLTGTFSATRYEYFQPGMHTAQQARDIISELATHRAEVVLLEISFANKIPISWPQTAVAAIANDPVADYILQNYRACRVLESPRGWRFVYLVQDREDCPNDD